MRIWHRDARTPDALARRVHGPLLRFDPHRPGGDVLAGDDPEGRSVIYLARRLGTALVEVFGDTPIAEICANANATLCRPTAPTVVQSLVGANLMAIGALPALTQGDVPRVESQAWARAIYEDRPADPALCGVRYSSAHDEGVCLALWDTAPPLTIVEEHCLHDLWARVTVALAQRAVPVARVARCQRCD